MFQPTFSVDEAFLRFMFQFDLFMAGQKQQTKKTTNDFLCILIYRPPTYYPMDFLHQCLSGLSFS